MDRLCFAAFPPIILRQLKRQRARRPLCTSSQSPAASKTVPRKLALPHEPVLLEPILSHFRGENLGLFVDCTVGAGGHASALLSTCAIRRYLGLDKDRLALRLANAALSPFPEVEVVHADFRDLPVILSNESADGGVDGVLVDLGVSSMQLDDADRGFSFMRDGPLDMRMDRDSGGRTAADIVNSAPEAELARIFWRYADDTRSRLRAARVVAARREAPITTTGQLASALLLPGEGRGKTHPATLPFQALRIAVNTELDAVERVLPCIIDVLRPGGTAAVISFHSIEDRMVKNVFRDAEVVGGVDVLTRKPVVADRGEVKRNPRSRSAKMRIVRKLAEGETPKRFKQNKYR